MSNLKPIPQSLKREFLIELTPQHSNSINKYTDHELNMVFNGNELTPNYMKDFRRSFSHLDSSKRPPWYDTIIKYEKIFRSYYNDKCETNT